MVELVCIDFDCTVVSGKIVEMWYCEIHRILGEHLCLGVVSRTVWLNGR